jgi:glycerol-3-phosphate dehydrogenase (NAD(P)+)
MRVHVTTSREHVNTTYLPDIPLSPSLRATTDVAAALEGAELVLFVIPTPFLCDFLLAHM